MDPAELQQAITAIEHELDRIATTRSILQTGLDAARQNLARILPKGLLINGQFVYGQPSLQLPHTEAAKAEAALL